MSSEDRSAPHRWTRWLPLVVPIPFVIGMVGAFGGGGTTSLLRGLAASIGLGIMGILVGGTRTRLGKLRPIGVLGALMWLVVIGAFLWMAYEWSRWTF